MSRKERIGKVDIFNETMMGNAFDIYVNLLGLPSAPCELVCILKYTDCHFCCFADESISHELSVLITVQQPTLTSPVPVQRQVY